MDNQVVVELFAAAKQGRVEDLPEIIKRDPHAVNSADDLGNSPLHYAAAGGHEEACRILLKAQANMNAINARYETPIHKVSNRPY